MTEIQESNKIVEEIYQKFGTFSLPYQTDVRRFTENVKLLQWVAQCLPPKKGRLLDIASGPGLLVAAGQKVGFTSEGVDKYIFPQNDNTYFKIQEIEKLQQIWQGFGVTVQPWSYDEISSRYLAGSLQVITCDAFVEHLTESPRNLLTDAFKLLEPGGYFILTTPNLVSLLRRVRFMLGYSCMWDFKDYWQSDLFLGHRREFTVSEIEKMCQSTGFEVKQLYTKNVYPLGEIKKYGLVKIFVRSLISVFSRFVPNSGEIIYLVAQKPKG